MASNRMTEYIAPDGYVYDWLEPHTATIKNTDGIIETTEEHLYAKYLYLGKFDSIKNYKVVKDPREKANK